MEHPPITGNVGSDSCGILATIKSGKASHDLLCEALHECCSLDHRGGKLPLDGSGDGIGIVTSMPREWICHRLGSAELGKKSPHFPDMVSCGLLFLAKNLDEETRRRILAAIEKQAGQFRLRIHAFEEAPFVTAHLGMRAKNSAPVPYYVYFEPLISSRKIRHYSFEQNVYMFQQWIERTTELAIERKQLPAEALRIVSLSPYVLVHKGMGNADDLRKTWSVLQQQDYRITWYALHRRFSTNTFPQWWLAQPFFMMLHNGEINTIRRNRRTAGHLENHLQNLRRYSKVLSINGSDTADMDRVLQQRYFAFRNFYQSSIALLATLETIIPPALHSPYFDAKKEFMAFMHFHQRHLGGGSFFGGPAFCIAYTRDTIAAINDNMALRPAKFRVAKWLDPQTGKHEDCFSVASEFGAFHGNVLENTYDGGILGPGDLIRASIQDGTLEVSRSQQCRSLIVQHTDPKILFHIKRRMTHSLVELCPNPEPEEDSSEDVLRRAQIRSGWKQEQLYNLQHMAAYGQLRVTAMGTPWPMAVLRSCRVFEAVQQCFAQVTNPSIDSIREGDKFNLASYLGGRGYNTDEYSTSPIEQIHLASAIVTNADICRLKQHNYFHVAVIDCSIDIAKVSDGKGYRAVLENLDEQVAQVVAKGARVLILSHRRQRRHMVPIEMPLALGAASNALNQSNRRQQVSLVIESDDICEAHDIALLLAMGASAVNPCLAEETVARGIHYMPEFVQEEMHLRQAYSQRVGVKVDKKHRKKYVKQVDGATAVKNLYAAFESGLKKIMGKMGINDIDGYRASGLFEILGLGKDIAVYLENLLPSRIGGQNLDDRFRYLQFLASQGDQNMPCYRTELNAWKNRSHDKRGISVDRLVIKPLRLLMHDEHLQNIDFFTRQFDPYALPLSILQSIYDAFAELRTEMAESPPFQLRDLLAIKGVGDLNQEKITPADAQMAIADIVPRLKSGQMSFGALLQWAKEAIELGLGAIGSYGGSGEGGLPPNLLDGAYPRSVQVASGRFGVTIEYLAHPTVREICIKIAQGAKPGEGGQLPGYKVFFEIARNRYCEVGTELISPPPHHDIYSIEELTQLIEDLRCANPTAKIAVKLVAGPGVGMIATGVVKTGADIVEMDGYEGGTGARSFESHHAGLPSELGIREIHQALVESELRDLVCFRAMGGIKSATDIVKYFIMGADEIAAGTLSMVALNCNLQANCNVGCGIQIAHPLASAKRTFGELQQAYGDEETYRNFVRQRAKQVSLLFLALALEIAVIIRKLGYKNVDDIVGRTELLVRKGELEKMAAKIDTGYLTTSSKAERELVEAGKLHSQNRRCWDRTAQLRLRQEWVLAERYPNDHRWPKEVISLDSQHDRSFGAYLAGLRLRNGITTPLNIHTSGCAGNSYAVWGASGMHFCHRGTAEEGFAKGISAGCKVSLLRPGLFNESSKAHIPLVSNNVGFGATGGHIFVDSLTGQRCGIRLSGIAQLFARGGGEYAAEYMTGGKIILLPDPIIAGSYDVIRGIFGAGMSGGVAFVFVNRKQNTSAHLDSALEFLELDQNPPLLEAFCDTLASFVDLGLTTSEIEYWQQHFRNDKGCVLCIRPKSR